MNRDGYCAALRHALLALALALALVPSALAHGAGSTLPGDTLARATPLGLPARVFDEAPADPDTHYYRVDLPRATSLRLRVVAPVDAAPAQPPVILFFGGEFEGNASGPSEVERPDMGGVSFVAGERAEVDEGRLGTRFAVLLDRSFELEAGPHVLVLRTQSAGPVALLLDTPAARWIDPFLLPGLRDDARAWRGDAAWPALAAGALGMAAVGAVGWRWRARPWSLHAMGGHILALLAAGTSLALAADAVRTGAGWLHAAAGLAAAAMALASTRPPRPRPLWWQRALLAAAALVAFFACAGALWGPVAALVAAALPEPTEG